MSENFITSRENAKKAGLKKWSSCYSAHSFGHKFCPENQWKFPEWSQATSEKNWWIWSSTKLLRFQGSFRWAAGTHKWLSLWTTQHSWFVVWSSGCGKVDRRDCGLKNFPLKAFENQGRTEAKGVKASRPLQFLLRKLVFRQFKHSEEVWNTQEAIHLHSEGGIKFSADFFTGNRFVGISGIPRRNWHPQVIMPLSVPSVERTLDAHLSFSVISFHCRAKWLGPLTNGQGRSRGVLVQKIATLDGVSSAKDTKTFEIFPYVVRA